MAHELDFSIGRAAIAYAGQVPWHGFGIQLDPNADLDQWRIAAGLDWEVREEPIYWRNGYINRPVADRKVLIRSDNLADLSVVSNRYKVFQPREVLGFFKDEVQKAGFQMEVAGALMGGKRIWALASIDDSFTLFGRDATKGYVLMATSFDGAMATQAMLTTVRVVCNNTMEASGAYGDVDGADRYSVSHTSTFNTDHARGKLGLDEKAWLGWKAHMENLARFQVSKEQALEFFFGVAGQGKEIVRNDENGQIISFPEPGQVVRKMIEAYKSGPGAELPSANGTAYGLLNAVTFYQDHLAPASDRGVRFNSATFGGGNRRKKDALERLDKMLEAA